jgi:hypothetical protein
MNDSSTSAIAEAADVVATRWACLHCGLSPAPYSYLPTLQRISAVLSAAWRSFCAGGACFLPSCYWPRSHEGHAGSCRIPCVSACSHHDNVFALKQCCSIYWPLHSIPHGLFVPDWLGVQLQLRGFRAAELSLESAPPRVVISCYFIQIKIHSRKQYISLYISAEQPLFDSTAASTQACHWRHKNTCVNM